MKEIKFRSKAIEKVWGGGIEVGQLVYGYYFVELVDIEDNIRFEYQHFIKSPYGDHFQDARIDEKTLSQYTGLKDKNGVEIYEGDICHCRGAYYEVKQHINGIYELHLLNSDEFPKIRKINILEQYLDQIEVVDSICENKELLNA